jgi:ribonuclease HII
MKKNKLLKKYPGFLEEKKIWRKGYEIVVGLDEVGRGPIAGPVIAAAVALKKKNVAADLKKLSVDDSKKLSREKREVIYSKLINHADIYWGIGRVSNKIIDKNNILEASKMAMVKALKQLEKKNKVKGSFLVLDGNFTIDSCLPQRPIIKGDEKVFSCAAASIIAKVFRDRIMRNYSRQYPLYGFEKHKGYGTKFHLKMLRKYKPCEIHRKSFKPVSRIIEKKRNCRLSNHDRI